MHMMTRKAKTREGLNGKLDLDMPSTAIAFRAAAESYTKKAAKTKATAVKTLQRERILTKDGNLTKAYE